MCTACTSSLSLSLSLQITAPADPYPLKPCSRVGEMDTVSLWADGPCVGVVMCEVWSCDRMQDMAEVGMEEDVKTLAVADVAKQVSTHTI